MNKSIVTIRSVRSFFL